MNLGSFCFGQNLESQSVPPILLGCRLCCFILRSESDNSKKRKKEKYSKSISPIQSFSILFSHPFCKVTEGSPGSPTLIHHSGICSCSLRNVQNGLTGEKQKNILHGKARAHAPFRVIQATCRGAEPESGGTCQVVTSSKMVEMRQGGFQLL